MNLMPPETCYGNVHPRSRFLGRFAPILMLVALCWGGFVLNNLVLGGRLNAHGIWPRHLAGLAGILWAPLLHGSYQHLLANSVPLLVLGIILCGRSRSEFGLVTAAGVLMSGALTWAFARDASHIGASGLVFCYFGYLASLAWFRRTFGTLFISAVCILAYGGMLRGLLPNSSGVSWEGHVAGLAAGIVSGWIGSKLRSPATANSGAAAPGNDRAT